MAELPPPPEVRAAFGAQGDPVRLAGGKGGTWRVGDVVLKPSEGDDEVRWRAGVLHSLPRSPHFRVARPVRAADGDWIAGGWEATEAVAGQPDQRRVDDVIRAGAAFHEALTAVPRPAFLDTRQNPWAYGEWLAFEDESFPGQRRPSKLLDELLELRRPVLSAEQIVHGDLLGNLLFADGRPPAVIDWPAYWRPPAWASAVAAIDAVVWHGVGPELLDRWAHLPEWDQMLVRAAIYRLGTWDAAGWSGEPEDAYHPVVEMCRTRVLGSGA
ncbi:TIGR02569 family protein [Actinoplanes friuliensis]|uniref:Aminoglycoside phosphotransferase n=1 Tax=Actinoplanes friuliensis DSM 7358 TaxID=1246995 RepID=U5VWI4_9ACTN|nr:TIGR02569 family protein [Actinoplanes friuliensis]AGZ40055.1 aminoglycoside phosphotransferase [Actinoplanes friuliensis DSM 7358]